MMRIKVMALSGALLLAGAARAFLGFGEPISVDALTMTGAMPCEDARYVRRVVGMGAQDRGWQVVASEAGAVDVMIEREALMLKMRVTCNAGAYRMAYLDSRNMDYNPTTRMIGKKCARWTRNLKASIDSAVALTPPPEEKPADATPALPSAETKTVVAMPKLSPPEVKTGDAMPALPPPGSAKNGRFCTECGERAEPTAKFCSACGHKL